MTEVGCRNPMDHASCPALPECGFVVHLAHADPWRQRRETPRAAVEATEKGMPSRHTVTWVHTCTYDLKFQTIDTHTHEALHCMDTMRNTDITPPNKNCKHIKVALEYVFEIFWKYF